MNDIQMELESFNQCLAWAKENTEQRIEDLMEVDVYFENSQGMEVSSCVSLFVLCESMHKKITELSDYIYNNLDPRKRIVNAPNLAPNENTAIARNEIRDAYLFLRENNHSISSETLEFMKEVSLEQLKKQANKNPGKKDTAELVLRDIRIKDLEEQIDKAAESLPLGATVYIAVENGSAYIEAANINDEVFDIDTSDMTLEEEFDAAIQWCKDTTELASK